MGWRLPASIDLTAHNQQQQQNRLREWERERGRDREWKKNFKIPTDKRYFFIWQREKCKFAIYQEHCQVSIIKIQWKKCARAIEKQTRKWHSNVSTGIWQSNNKFESPYRLFFDWTKRISIKFELQSR